jgi:alpha-L-fucosidase
VDIPKLYAEASEAEGMKYGFYISPWDRNSALYGKPQYVTDVFLKQATELAAYGHDQFEMWFDGANGGDGYYGGEGGLRNIDASTYYDMPNLADSIHKLQPNCVMWGMGGEARWIGNEAGWAEITNWSNETENGSFWNAGEADAKATDKGWFWHEGESPRSTETLYKMYLETVGRNATLILNFPPNNQGVLPTATVNVLKNMGTMLKNRLETDFAPQATVSVSEERTAGVNRNYIAANLTDGDKNTYWATNDGTIESTITLNWDTPITAHYVMLQEFIRKGQRIKAFKIETSTDGTTFTQRASNISTTVGYKRIIPLNGSTDNYGDGFSVKTIKITITDSKACPLLHNVSVY